MEWRQFVMNLESMDVYRVEEVLERHGAQSITLSDAGDNPVLEPAPGETPLWSESKILGLFATETDFEKLRLDLKTSLGCTSLPLNYIEEVADRDWQREWLKDFGPMQFGERLWVSPGEFTIEANEAAETVIVRLDPGLAFGTGTHATTALCLEWLEQIKICGKTVLDFGCGSGILSIAALKLGALSVTATDIDLQAIVATRQNALRNNVDDRLHTTQQSDDIEDRFDIVVANILAGTLIEQAAFICDRLKPGSNLALAGVLSEQANEVADAYRHCINFAPPVYRDNWARLTGSRT